MSVEKRVPEIRFQGFSGEWLNNSIEGICGATFGGGTPSTNDKDFWQGEIPWIQSSDLKDGIVSSVTAKKYITKSAVNKSATKLISGNSIAIVTRVGVGKLSLMQGEYATSQDFLSLSDLKIDSQYAVYVLWKQLQVEKEQVQGTSIKGITKDELLGKFVSYPETEEEQAAIGNYFQKLDTLINQHQQKHDKLSNLKKAMLVKMFPKQGETIPEIRFKGFGGDWENIRLGDVATCFSGGTPPVGVEEYYKGNIPFIRSAEINKATTELTISESGLKNSSAKMIEIGTVLYALYGATSGEVGRAKLCGAINQAILAIIPMARMCPEFLSQWLRKSKSSIVSTYLQGGQGNLSGDIVKNLVLVSPTFEEQTAIGNYFQKLDTLINQHQHQITKLNNIKQACLNKMFV
jgi:type I restriction enzyme S subunit